MQPASLPAPAIGRCSPVRVGDGATIGSGAIVLGGVTIGAGALDRRGCGRHPRRCGAGDRCWRPGARASRGRSRSGRRRRRTDAGSAFARRRARAGRVRSDASRSRQRRRPAGRRSPWRRSASRSRSAGRPVSTSWPTTRRCARKEMIGRVVDDQARSGGVSRASACAAATFVAGSGARATSTRWICCTNAQR